MRFLSGSFLSICLAAGSAFAAGFPVTQIQGDYVEARTADVYTGPCFANSEVGLVGDLAVFGWHVKQGSWQGVNLDGLSVMGVIRASNTLGDPHITAYPVKSVLIIDEKATPEQRLALSGFAKKMGGDLLQDVVRVDYQPMTFALEGSMHAAKATFIAGTEARIQTRPINAGDHICSNEEVWYSPLTRLDHAMPAYALAHNFRGQGLGSTWSSPEKRSAFVGSFHYSD